MAMRWSDFSRSPTVVICPSPYARQCYLQLSGNCFETRRRPRAVCPRFSSSLLQKDRFLKRSVLLYLCTRHTHMALSLSMVEPNIWARQTTISNQKEACDDFDTRQSGQWHKIASRWDRW